MRYVDHTHIALRFSDLRAAEAYYCELFDLRVAWRDTNGSVSMFASWAEMDAAGAAPWVSALYRDNLRFTVEVGDGAPARTAVGLDHLGLHVSRAQLARVAGRAEALELDVEDGPGGMLAFGDRNGLRWELDTRSHADLVALGQDLEEMYRQRRG